MRLFSIAVLLFLGAGVPGLAQPSLGSANAPDVHSAGPGQSSSVTGVTSARTQIVSGDFLAISVFDVPELAQSIRVDDAGNADVALLGSTHLAGMTTADAQNLIRTRLKEGDYVRDPHVSVTIREYASHTTGGALQGTPGVSVLGEVSKPGFYPMLSPRTLLEMVSDAGGPTPYAAHEVTVKRKNGEVLHANLSNNPSELLAGNFKLELGDMLVVPKAGIAYILGDVGRPGGFVMQDNGKMSLLQLVALGGGTNRTASTKHARLLRKATSGLRTEEINLTEVMRGKSPDVVINPDDVLFVPNSALKSFTGGSAQSLMNSAAGAAIYSGITTR